MQPPADRLRPRGQGRAGRPRGTGSTPSSKVRRRPSTARCKIAGTVEDKVHSFRGQAQAGGHLRRTASTRPAPAHRARTTERESSNRNTWRSRVLAGDRGAWPGRRHGPAPRSRLRARAPGRSPRSTPARATQRANTKGKPGQRLPGLGQVDHLVKRLVRAPPSPGRRSPAPRRPCSPARARPAAVARSARAAHRGSASSQTRASTWLVREPSSSASRSIRSNGTRLNSLTLRTGPLRRDRKPRHDLVAAHDPSEVLDRRDQATSSAPAASCSASRLGTSMVSPMSGAKSQSL